jgi:hypothetical protein
MPFIVRVGESRTIKWFYLPVVNKESTKIKAFFYALISSEYVSGLNIYITVWRLGDGRRWGTYISNSYFHYSINIWSSAILLMLSA